MTARIIASIEARMASTRLPGKVMLPILDKPMLAHMVKRVQQSYYIDKVVIATTTNRDCDAIGDYFQPYIDPAVFCGSEENVLDRLIVLCAVYQPTILVRLTGDCPLIDAQTIDRAVHTFLTEHVDFVANDFAYSGYPVGTAVEVFRPSLLRHIASVSDDPRDREHVTHYVYRNRDEFSCHNVLAPWHVRYADYRVTVDTPEDFEVVRRVFEHFGNDDFTLDAAIGWLDAHPKVRAINAQVKQRQP